MKKTLSLCLVALMLCAVTMTGCGKAAAQPEITANINRAFITGDSDGSSLLVVNLDVTNNRDMSYYSSVVASYSSATLDGEKLSSAYLPYQHPEELDLNSTINPGETGLAQAVFTLPSTEGTVELTINAETLDYSGTVEILKEEISLDTLEAVESEAEFEIEIGDVVVTDDGDDKDLLVMNLTFTNNSDEANSFGSAVDFEIFQNDISLKSGYLPYNHPSADEALSSNTYTDVKKGASLEVQVVYELNDPSAPIEVKAVDAWSFDKRVLFEKVIEIAGAAPATEAAA